MTKNVVYLSAVLLMILASAGMVMAQQYKVNQPVVDTANISQPNVSAICPCKEAGLDCGCKAKSKTCACGQNGQTCGCGSACHQTSQ